MITDVEALTTHKVFGEDFGILAGDALLNYAYEVMTSAVCAASPENMKNCAGAAAVIARKAGILEWSVDSRLMCCLQTSL